MVESRSMVRGRAPGPAPAPHARASRCRETASSCRAWPQVKDRRKVPTVEGARTSQPSTASVEPAPSMFAWSIESPPGKRGEDEGHSLHAHVTPPGAFPRSTCSPQRARSLNFSARLAGKRRPASVTAWRPEKATDRRQRLWEDCISRVPFCLGFCGVSQLTFSQERGHLSSICHPIFARLVAGSGLKQNV